YERCEESVDAFPPDRSSLYFRNLFGNVVGARRLVEARQRVEHRGAHVGPLLALAGQAFARGLGERIALVELVIVPGHCGYVARKSLAARRARNWGQGIRRPGSSTRSCACGRRRGRGRRRW